MTKNEKTVKKILLILLLIFLMISIAPYFFKLSRSQYEYAAPPFDESRFAELDGIRVHYRLWTPQGDMTGRVMMIHGLGGSAYSWERCVDSLLKEGLLVVAVDLPGFGYSQRRPGTDHSQKSRSRSLWQLAKTVDELEDVTSGDKWILVGHSMGGGTAAAMALSGHDNTKALVLVAGALFDNSNTAGRLLVTYPPAARLARVILEKYALTPERISSFLSSAYGRMPEGEEIEGYLKPLLIPGTSATLIDMIKTSGNVSVDDLKQISVPVLGIWGEDDSWVPLTNAYKIQEYMPHMTLRVIEDSAHCPMETDSDEFNKILVEFIRNIR